MAYFIAGHGLEDGPPFIVPDGCYIVVKMDTCTLADYQNDYIPSFHQLMKLDKKILLDPSRYQKEM